MPVTRLSGKRVAALVLGALTPLFLFVCWLQVRIDEHFGSYRATEEILYIEDGDLLRKALLGYDNLAADLYWMRTVQYFGGKRVYEPGKRFDLLEPLLQITTDLDPKLDIAYSYGATFSFGAISQGSGSADQRHRAGRQRHSKQPRSLAPVPGQRIHLLLVPEGLQEGRRDLSRGKQTARCALLDGDDGKSRYHAGR